MCARGPHHAHRNVVRSGAVLTRGVAGDQRREGQAVADGEDSTHLPPVGKRLRRGRSALQFGQLPQSIDHADAAGVEVGRSAVQMAIDEQSGRGILKLRGKHARRESIDALLPGERSLRLEAVTEFFLQARLKRVVVRAVAPRQLAGRPDVGIESSAAAHRRRKQIPLRRPRRRDDIGVVEHADHVHATRSRVGDKQSQVRSERALHARVPLHHIVAARIVFDARLPHRRIAWVQAQNRFVSTVGERAGGRVDQNHQTRKTVRCSLRSC